MSVKSFQAKVVCDTPEKREYLWLTHRLFNQGVCELLPYLFKMRRGDLGHEFKTIYEAIRNSQNSFAKLEPITTTKAWSSKHVGTGDPKNQWAVLCAKLNASGRILFDRDKPPFAYASEFWRKICEMAVQLMHSHDGLFKDWREERAAWKERKADWESNHQLYMKAKPTLDAFQEEAGRLSGSRKRWLLYLDFLAKHPELAAWHGGKAHVDPLTAQERKGCRRPGDHFDIFWDKNPELAALNALDRTWRREFANFKRRPTWTNPSPEKHPAWYSFKRGATYKDLDLATGTLRLRVLTGDDGKGRRGEWHAYTFQADNRLRRLRPAPESVKIGRNSFSWLYADPFLGIDRPAEVRGIKLVFRAKRPYLLFSVDIADEQLARLTRPGFKDTESGKTATPADIPDGTRFLAVDFGQRTLGACSVCAFKDGEPLPPESVFLLRLPGLSFSDIGRHESTIRRRTSKMYRSGPRRRRTHHAPRGGTTFADQRHHVLKMKEDRYKKAANLLIKAALRHRASVILVENLRNYRPDLERPARENRARMQWNVQRIIEFLDKTAKPLGIRLWRVSPWYSSQFCSACGHPGKRFSIPRKTRWEHFYARRHGPVRKPVIEPGGQFFVCSNPDCPRPTGIIHADVNASLNLHRILAETFERPQGKGKQKTWQGQPLNWKPITDQCRARIETHFLANKADLAAQTPW